MGRYVVEGKLHDINDRIFIETELNENNEPCGTWLHEVIKKIPDGSKITVVIDFEK